MAPVVLRREGLPTVQLRERTAGPPQRVTNPSGECPGSALQEELEACRVALAAGYEHILRRGLLAVHGHLGVQDDEILEVLVI